MISTKKGDATVFIVGTILVLISFFLIAGLLIRFTSKSSDAEAELLCQVSIAQRARTALTMEQKAWDVSVFKSQVKTIPPICRTVDKKVAGDRRKILGQVADNMARCWWMFGEGKYEDILDSANANVFPEVLGLSDSGPNQCFNCYTILIAQEEISGGPISAEEIIEYLSKNVYGRVNKTYLDYIQGYRGPGRIVLTIPDIQPRQAYAISMMPKKQKASAFWSEVVSSSTLPGQVYSLYNDYQQSLGKAYDERDVSSIFLGPLKLGQELCGEGDIAGK